jgi:hypothetical protein
VVATWGEWTWAEIIAVAEQHAGGALPTDLLGSVDSLGELCEWLKVRAAHGAVG